MTSLILRTPSSSFCRRALRVCSVSYFDTPLPLREMRGSLLSKEWESVCLGCLEVRDGDAKTSSVSDESEKLGLPVSGVAILCQVNTRSMTILNTVLERQTRRYTVF